MSQKSARIALIFMRREVHGLKIKLVAKEYSFFHWDLEFPDIFYDIDGRRKKNPGFDAVVGNPPYGRYN